MPPTPQPPTYRHARRLEESCVAAHRGERAVRGLDADSESLATSSSLLARAATGASSSALGGAGEEEDGDGGLGVRVGQAEAGVGRVGRWLLVGPAAVVLLPGLKGRQGVRGVLPQARPWLVSVRWGLLLLLQPLPPPSPGLPSSSRASWLMADGLTTTHGRLRRSLVTVTTVVDAPFSR